MSMVPSSPGLSWDVWFRTTLRSMIDRPKSSNSFFVYIQHELGPAATRVPRAPRLVVANVSALRFAPMTKPSLLLPRGARPSQLWVHRLG